VSPVIVPLTAYWFVEQTTATLLTGEVAVPVPLATVQVCHGK
jgi:hypothetical protein